MKGKAPKVAIATHAKVENKNVCLRFNLYSCCKFASTNSTPIKIVTNDDDKKL